MQPDLLSLITFEFNDFICVSLQNILTITCSECWSSTSREVILSRKDVICKRQIMFLCLCCTVKYINRLIFVHNYLRTENIKSDTKSSNREFFKRLNKSN